jgi:pilus assembly protein CpaC
LRFNAFGGTLTAFIDALKEEGLVKILAEPTLIALSGQTADFLVGGEFPVPVPQGNQTISIDYKDFGVKLSFLPTVIDENRISIKVAPEVSNLDVRNSIKFSGFVVPGLTTRRTSTLVELGDGQSFAIAGLLSEETRDSATKYPFLGDVPILGRLFQSRSFQKAETELVIIVTPHIVKPLDKTKQTLPTDFYNEPDDTEFYIYGLMEGKNSSSHKVKIEELDGKFGHEIPSIQ